MWLKASTLQPLYTCTHTHLHICCCACLHARMDACKHACADAWVHGRTHANITNMLLQDRVAIWQAIDVACLLDQPDRVRAHVAAIPATCRLDRADVRWLCVLLGRSPLFFGGSLLSVAASRLSLPGVCLAFAHSPQFINKCGQKKTPHLPFFLSLGVDKKCSCWPSTLDCRTWCGA